MSNVEDSQEIDLRRKRINRIKKAVIITVMILIIIPIVLCIILMCKVISLQNQVDELLSYKEEGRLEASIDVYGKKHLRVLSDNDLAQKQVQIDKTERTSDELDGFITDNESDSTTEGETPTSTKEMETTTPAGDTQKRGYGKTVYLTFDDGPSQNTEKIISILEQYGVKATFFVLAKDDEESIGRYKSIVESGNTLGLHSYSHNYSEIYKDLVSFIEDVTKIHDFVYNVTGIDVKIYRFAGGSANSTAVVDIHECIDYLNTHGYTYYDWNVSSGDASGNLLTVDEIMANIETDIFRMNTAIVLMHDSASKTTTVETLPVLIEMLLDEGFEIKAIDKDTATIQQILAN